MKKLSENNMTEVSVELSKSEIVVGASLIATGLIALSLIEYQIAKKLNNCEPVKKDQYGMCEEYRDYRRTREVAPFLGSNW